MANFLAKAKDLYFDDQERYAHFQDVFRKIGEFSVAKNYFETDLFNLEEVFSILEMARHLGHKRSSTQFSSFLSDVVTQYTPGLKEHSGGLGDTNWHSLLFGAEPLDRDYGNFVGALHNLRIGRDSDRGNRNAPGPFRLARSVRPAARYSVVTLNYDLVLERYSPFLQALLDTESDILRFGDVSGTPETDYGERPVLVKLHGSAGSDSLVPPTWNKTPDTRMLAAWRTAYQILRAANHIRIVGYSLPESDAYVRYLLKAAVLEAPHLKRIDVLCLDPDGSARRRFDQLLKPPVYRFMSADVVAYLEAHRKLNDLEDQSGYRVLELIRLEQAHESFFSH